MVDPAIQYLSISFKQSYLLLFLAHSWLWMAFSILIVVVNLIYLNLIKLLLLFDIKSCGSNKKPYCKSFECIVKMS